MARSLHGSLSYLGVKAPTPPNLVNFDSSPTSGDYKSFNIGDIWLQLNTVNIWMLTSKANGKSTWTDISSEGGDTFTSIRITTGDLTMDEGDFNITLGDINVGQGDVAINNGNLVLGVINYASTLRTLPNGTVYGLVDGIIPAIDEGTVYHINDTGVARWGDVRSAGGTVTITTTADGINLEAAGGTASNTYTTDDGFGVVPDGAGNVDIEGGTNITTVGAVAHTITYNLDDTITLTKVNAKTFDTDVAAAGVTLSDTTLEADGSDIDIDINIIPKGFGIVNIYGGIATDLLSGVVQSDAAGVLSSSEGTNGQILISSSTGSPLWGNITSATLDITEGANTINIESLGDYTLSINEQTGVIYTLVIADAGKEIQMDNAGAITLTIPTKTAVAFPVGTEIIIVQYGAGTVTVSAAAGVTINSASGMKDLYEQYSAAALIKQSDDVEGSWLLAGDIK